MVAQARKAELVKTDLKLHPALTISMAINLPDIHEMHVTPAQTDNNLDTMKHKNQSPPKKIQQNTP